MKKLFTLFALLFFISSSFAQLNLKVQVNSINVLNNVDCDAGGSDNSDFIFEFKATDNSLAANSNNSPTLGSIGACNYAVVNENNGPFSLTPVAPGSAVFSPTTGIFFNRNYNCKKDIPTGITITWRGYENDDISVPSITPVASGTTSIDSHTIAIAIQPAYTQVVQYTLTSTDGGCPQTYVINLSVSVSYGSFEPLRIEEVNESIICVGGNNGILEAHVTGGSGSILKDWSYDGLGEYDDLDVASGLSAGSYTFVAKDGLNCTDTVVATIREQNQPTPLSVFTIFTPTLCAGQNGVVYAVSSETNTVYFWNYSGTGTNPLVNTTNSITIDYSNSASSGVLSVYAQNSCSITPSLTMAVTVVATPTVNILGNFSMCNNSQEELVALGAGSYTWSTGANTASITITPTITTVYSVTGSMLGCSASNQFTMTVLASPTVQINGSSAPICATQTLVLTANGNGNFYIWSDNFIGNVHAISSSSTVVYGVTAISVNSCFAQANYTLNINPSPVISVTGNTIVCPSKTVTLTASGADSFNWSTGNLTSSITYTPSSVSVLTVTGTNTLTSCASNATISVGNYTVGVMSIVGSSTVCANVEQIYTASGSDFYLWNNGATANTNTLSLTITTVLSVVGTNVNGCKDSTMFAVGVIDVQIASISGADSICKGQNTTLVVIATGATNYSWNSGNSGASILVAPTTTFTYIVTASNGICSAVEPHEVFVKTPPTVNFSISQNLCAADGPYTLSATPLGGLYVGSGVSGNTFDPSVGVGTYAITYQTTGSNNCSASASQSIHVVACVGIEEINQPSVITLYPNPTASEVTIHADQLVKGITIYDYMGKFVQSVEMNSFEKTINVSTLSKGIYTFSILTNEATYKSIKVIKE